MKGSKITMKKDRKIRRMPNEEFISICKNWIFLNESQGLDYKVRDIAEMYNVIPNTLHKRLGVSGPKLLALDDFKLIRKYMTHNFTKGTKDYRMKHYDPKIHAAPPKTALSKQDVINLLEDLKYSNIRITNAFEDYTDVFNLYIKLHAKSRNKSLSFKKRKFFNSQIELLEKIISTNQKIVENIKETNIKITKTVYELK